MMCEQLQSINGPCFVVRVGKPETIQPVGAFGTWLYNSRKQAGLDKKQLAIRAGVGQSSITQLEGGIRKPSRAMVLKLALGMAPDIETRDRLADAGLKSAGFMSENTIDLDAIVNQIPAEDLPRLLTRVAERMNRDILSPQERGITDARNAAEAKRQAEMSIKEREHQAAADEKRAREGRKRG